MDYKNCCNPKCQKFALTNRFTGLCKECNEEIFQRIKTYLEENGSQDLHTIARDNHIPDKIVEGYIKDGRLEDVLKNANVVLRHCSRCGAPTSNEGLCNKCINLDNLRELKNQLDSSKQETKPQESQGMHFIGKGQK